MGNTLDSNSVSLYYAREIAPKQLDAIPNWRELEPNSYGSFGGTVSTIARNPINFTRQKRKGGVTGIEASCEFEQDFTQSNFQRLSQGFFYAKMREKFSTHYLDETLTPNVITNVDGTLNNYVGVGALDGFPANTLIFANGFSNPENNGLAVVTASTPTTVTVSKSLVDEVTTNAASLTTVGISAQSGDLVLSVDVNGVYLTSTLLDFTTLGLINGEFIGVGGDDILNRFDSGFPFFGKIQTIETNRLVFDEVSTTVFNDAGVGKEIHLYFARVLKNEDSCDLISKDTFQFERQLDCRTGQIQSEYLLGGTPNQMTINSPLKDKIAANVSFIGMDVEYRDSVSGIKPGNRINAENEECYNTSSDVFLTRLKLKNPFDSAPLFTFINDFTLTINNSASPVEAIGEIGAIDTSLGEFDVNGSITAYFSTVAAIQAIRANSDVSMTAIFGNSNQNKGFIINIPLLSLSNAQVQVEKDQPVTVPLEHMAYENENGYTLMMQWFDYLPTLLTPYIN